MGAIVESELIWTAKLYVHCDKIKTWQVVM